ncbi:Hypothetical protein CINCED_3A006298 [Cinara cedri]|uniref:Uncharacterized protein n=1 Tax=Cinara cedri TaxID=506608 RepID=A0A5E4M9J2_9HEMI|nr:Hypothetical protein CINCED_3A006298 [Cinara cedri]
MKKKGGKTKEIENPEQEILASLNKELDAHYNKTKILFKQYDNVLSEIEDAAFHNHLLSYKRCLTMQMEFRDKLMEKLTDELEQFQEHRNRARLKNLELVNNTLMSFKKEIEAIHDQYTFEVELATSENLSELETKKKLYNTHWEILKYDHGAMKIKTQKDMSKLEKTHTEKMNTENGRQESIFDKHIWNDKEHCKIIKDKNLLVLDNYEKKTKILLDDYQKFKSKDENLEDLRTKLKTKIKESLKMISHLEEEIKEPKSLKELNVLIKKRDELQEDFKNVIQSLKDDSAAGEKQKILLCQITSPIENEITNLLKKGNELVKWIKICERLETHTQSNSYPMCTEPDDVQWPEPLAAMSKLTKFWHRVMNAKKNSKSIDEKIDRLKSERLQLKEEIRNFVKQKSKDPSHSSNSSGV